MNARVVDAVKAWAVPVTVTVAGPRAAVLLAVSVITLVPVVGFGVNDAVTPLGRPEAARLIKLPFKNPFWPVTVIPEVPEPPWTMDRDVGDAPMVKLGPGMSKRKKVVFAVSAPDVPVTVTV